MWCHKSEHWDIRVGVMDKKGYEKGDMRRVNMRLPERGKEIEAAKKRENVT